MRNLKLVTTVCSIFKRVSSHYPSLAPSISKVCSSLPANLSTSSLTMNKKNENEEKSTGSDNKRVKLDTIRSEFLALGNSGNFSQSPDGDGTFNLLKDAESGIALLAIRNVNKKNCFSGSMMAQLADFLVEVEQWKEGKALVLYGEKGFFSSGGDLDTVRQISTTEGGEKMIRLMQDNLARLQALPLITVAYIEGMALGGGAELVTACDYRLSRENAILGFVQVRIGITTVWGGGARLVQLIGYPKALNLIATGRTFSGVEGARMGFIDHLLPSVETVISNAHQQQQHLATKPPFSVARHQQEVLQNAKQFLMPFLVLPKETMLIGKAVASEGRAKLDDALRAEMAHGLKVWGGPIHQKALSGKVNHKRDA